MQIHLRLFASLRDSLPAADRGRADVELAEGASLADLISQLEIPEQLAQMVLVDGQQAPRQRGQRSEQILVAGQTVSIFPPVSGG